MKFHTVKFGARALLAIPANVPHLLEPAIHCYPTHTPKKRLIRSVLHLLSRLKLARIVFRGRSLSLPGVGEIDYESWMKTICDQLGVLEVNPVLVWPADPGRGRVYIYLLDAKGEKIGFCKLGLDEDNNSQIEREKLALLHLQKMDLKLSRIPGLLASGDLNGAAYLIAEMTPPEARVADWREDSSIDENILEYSGLHRMLERGEVEKLSWWVQLREKYASQGAFMKEVELVVDRGVEVCLVHGDLNCTNVWRHDNDVWLLDWEQSDVNGPSLTDQVCVAVDRIWADHSDDPEASLLKFRELFPESDDEERRGRVILALAYLGSVGFTPAIAIIEKWFPLTSEAV